MAKSELDCDNKGTADIDNPRDYLPSRMCWQGQYGSSKQPGTLTDDVHSLAVRHVSVNNM